jgi:hypothetical protein
MYKISGQFAHTLHYFKDENIGTTIQWVEFPTLKHYYDIDRTS